MIEQQYRYNDKEKFAGAIKKEKHVLAIDRKLQWKLAQILEVRYEVPYDEDAEFWDPTDNNEATAADAGGDAQINSAGSVPTEESKNGVPEGARQAEDPEATTEIVRAKQTVEYYVHYLDEERLMDRWVKENMVQINDELVENLKEDF